MSEKHLKRMKDQAARLNWQLSNVRVALGEVIKLVANYQSSLKDFIRENGGGGGGGSSSAQAGDICAGCNLAQEGCGLAKLSEQAGVCVAATSGGPGGLIIDAVEGGL